MDLLIQFFQSGGPFMYIISVVMGVGIAIAIDMVSVLPLLLLRCYY